MSTEADRFEEMYWSERLALFRTKDEEDDRPSRDELAMRAMQGLLACPSRGGWSESWGRLADDAYDIADAMINRRDTDARAAANS